MSIHDLWYFGFASIYLPYALERGSKEKQIYD